MRVLVRHYPIVFILLLISSLWADNAHMKNGEKLAIERLLKAQNVVERIQQSLNLQINEVRTKHPDFPQATFKVLQDSSSSTVIMDQLVQSWAGKFTVNELVQIRIFLSTSGGKKFMELNPQITADMMASGSLIGVHIYEILNQRHPDVYPMDEKMRKFKAQMIQGRDKARKGTDK